MMGDRTSSKDTQNKAMQVANIGIARGRMPLIHKANDTAASEKRGSGSRCEYHRRKPLQARVQQSRSHAYKRRGGKQCRPHGLFPTQNATAPQEARRPAGLTQELGGR